MTRKIKVLGIAPYDGIKTLMESAAASYPSIDLTVFVGDLNRGVEIAKQYMQSSYDVIISRGGTAELIEEMTTIPVVEIQLSVFDIFRSLRLVENFSGRYAVVGFPGISKPARALLDLLGRRTEVRTVHAAGEVKGVLLDLKRKGVVAVLCDTVTVNTAHELGMNAILLTSGAESVQAAFEQSEKISRSYMDIRERNHFLSMILQNQATRVMVFDDQGSLLYSSLEDASDSSLLPMLRSELPACRRSRTHKFFKSADGYLYSVTSRQIVFQERTCIVCYLTRGNAPLSNGRYGITYYNCRETNDLFFNNLFSVSGTYGEIQSAVSAMNRGLLPVMLIGERGTGHMAVADIIYRESGLSDNPLITVDAELLNDKGWNYLTNHYNSPLNDNNNTICFSHLDALGEIRLRQLLTILSDSNLCRRNRVIFSCTEQSRKPLSGLLQKYIETFSCIPLHLPPLRECRKDLPSIASFYLGTLNASLARQIIGFEDEAMALLQEYTWPGNYTQLKRVLNEAALMTDTSYISADSISSLLKQEHAVDDAASVSQASASSPSGAPGASEEASPNTLTLRLDQTMEQMNLAVIEAVISRCGGNQSRAAKELGISRTTMWRMMKRDS